MTDRQMTLFNISGLKLEIGCVQSKRAPYARLLESGKAMNPATIEAIVRQYDEEIDLLTKTMESLKRQVAN